jgi:hypothetical protein
VIQVRHELSTRFVIPAGNVPDPSTFREAGADLLAYDGAACAEAAGPLAEAVRRLEASSDEYELAGRPGRETSVIDVLRWAAEKCVQHPGATTMTIRARNV